MLEVLESAPETLFWSAPLATDTDFTAEDPLALDYLAQQVGLWLFEGFTTRTTRAQNYAVVLYGLHLADKAIEIYGYPADDGMRTRLFERWERFWALATLESRGGVLARGSDDAMRGIRGATQAWASSGPGPLPLDFPLISRQSELGSLGAYLSSLREYGLVFPGSLRVSPASREIIDAFWSEPGGKRMAYEEYALEALNLERNTLARSYGRLTLAGLGKRSRLSALVEHHRSAQQSRLWNALFESAHDGSTLEIAKCLIRAHKNHVVDAEILLKGLIAGRWGRLSAETRSKVELALAFGGVARELLQRFNRAYGHVEQQGWVAGIADVAHVAFPPDEAQELRSLCASASVSPRFRKLEFHGPGFVSLLTALQTSGPADSLQHLLKFHLQVQRARRGGGAWLREENGTLVLQVAGYTGHKAEAGFPSLKLNVVRRLLGDLGKLS